MATCACAFAPVFSVAAVARGDIRRGGQGAVEEGFSLAEARVCCHGDGEGFARRRGVCVRVAAAAAWCRTEEAAADLISDIVLLLRERHTHTETSK